jgi:protein TonB
MFESVSKSSEFNAVTYFASLLTSLALHAAILCVVVALPLVFCRTLYPPDRLIWLIDPPFLAVRSSGPPPPQILPPQEKVESVPHFVDLGLADRAPKTIPVGIPAPGELPNPVISGIYGERNGIPERGISSQSPADNSWIVDLLPKQTLELPPLASPRKPETVRVGGDVLASKLIYKVDPLYPELARLAHISGAVVLAAVIDEEGAVTDLRILSGHALLAKAAMEAVSRWKYSPTILNGEPVSVSATVTVVFRLR